MLGVEGNPLISEGKTAGFIEKLLLLSSKMNKNSSTLMKIEAVQCLEKIARLLMQFPNEFNALNNLVSSIKF